MKEEDPPLRKVEEVWGEKKESQRGAKL